MVGVVRLWEEGGRTLTLMDLGQSEGLQEAVDYHMTTMDLLYTHIQAI